MMIIVIIVIMIMIMIMVMAADAGQPPERPPRGFSKEGSNQRGFKGGLNPP